MIFFNKIKNDWKIKEPGGFFKVLNAFLMKRAYVQFN